MHSLLRFLFLVFFTALTLSAAPADDDLFSSKPGAKPSAPAKPALVQPARVSVALPAMVTATRIATGESGVETWQMEGIDAALPEVTFLQKRYVAGTTKGAVLYSADGQRWETAQLPSKQAVRQVLHDGKSWVALTDAEMPYLHFSADGKSWNSSKVWKLTGERLAVRDGSFWAAGEVLFTFSFYYRGKIDATTDERITDWDGQLKALRGPKVPMQSGRFLYLAMGDGQLFSSDNGEYWSLIGLASGLAKVNEAHIAEGNDRTIFAVMNAAAKAREISVMVQEGGESSWRRSTTLPFQHVRGLAYGGGRFVAVGSTAAGKYQDTAMYETTDGLNWTRIAAIDSGAATVAFGPAGFVAGGSAGRFFVYRPTALPEKPVPVRPATPVPTIKIVDFGRNYSGKGKYRKETGPQTPEQQRAKELSDLSVKAINGDAVAKCEIALEAVEGKYVESNPWGAELWFKEAMAAGEPRAPRGYALLLQKWKPTTPEKELAALFRLSAEKGDAPAMIWMVETPAGQAAATPAERKLWTVAAAEKDNRFKQREKFRTAYAENLAQADAGDPEACRILAGLLRNGQGVTRDLVRAEKYLRTAADKKDPEGMYQLADFLAGQTINGKFTTDALAAEYRQYLTAASDAGNREARIKLAVNLAEGQKTFTKDEPRAYAVHLKLAESGYAPSMAIVGRVLYVGGIVPKDETAGTGWVRKAAAANEPNAKAMLVEIEQMEQRAAVRPPLDGKVVGVTAEVFAALEKIQAAESALFDDAATLILFNAIWYDADYSALDEDLGQELASTTRPITLTANDGRNLDFTKPVPAPSVAGFGQIFPVQFNPSNFQYHFTFWQKTSNAGVIVGASRLSSQGKLTMEQGLTRGMFDAAQKDQAKPSADLVHLFKFLQAGHDAASPTVQKEFRALVRRALEQAKNVATTRANNNTLNGFVALPWLKEPLPPTPPAANP